MNIKQLCRRAHNRCQRLGAHKYGVVGRILLVNTLVADCYLHARGYDDNAAARSSHVLHRHVARAVYRLLDLAEYLGMDLAAELEYILNQP